MIVLVRLSAIWQWPVFLSTVTPGKLPTCCFSPVSILNKELLPLLGFPTNAILMFFIKLPASVVKINEEIEKSGAKLPALVG